MLRSIALFEIRYQLKQPLFYCVTLLFIFMTFSAITSDSVQIGGGIGNVNRNAPSVILHIMTIMSAIGVFVVTAFMAGSVHRDFAHETHEIFFSKPVRKFDYLIGRFIGSLVISFVIMIGPALGIVIGSLMPWLEAERICPFELAPYLYALFVIVLPNLFFIGAVFFTLAGLTRSMLTTYMGVVIFFVAYIISTFLLVDLEGEFLAGLLDPFGLAALGLATKYWTIVEKNTMLPALEGALLLNRLIWTGIGAIVLALGYSLFSFSKYASRKRFKKKTVVPELFEPETGYLPVQGFSALPSSARSFSTGDSWRQFVSRTRLETAGVLRSIPFLVMLAFGVFNVITGEALVETLFGTPVYPVTHLMLQSLHNAYLFMLIIIITFYSGELVWKERSLKLNEVCDSLPVSNSVLLWSKLTTLFLVVLVYAAVGMLAMMGYQIYRGYTNFEIGLYATGLSIEVIYYFLICFLAVTVQVLTNNKYLGYLLMILYLVSLTVLDTLDFDHYLYRFAEIPHVQYSDMNGYGHFVKPLFWFDIYWGFFTLLLVVLCVLLWVRGTEGSLKTRLKLAALRFRTPARAAMAAGLIGFLGTGSFIYYNTNIINEYIPTDRMEERKAEYEKKYRQYINVPMPRITDVTADVDIFPRERRVEIRGQYVLENKTAGAIDTLYLGISPKVTIDSLVFPGHSLVEGDSVLGYYIFALEEPLEPGERMTFDFDLTVANPGFVNNGSNTNVVFNGTFINNMDYFPSLGYDEFEQLTDRNTRRKYGLPQVQRMSKIDDESARLNTYFTRGADWINFETTVSTSLDQVAIAPGYLQREWTEGDRRYFHYKMDTPILNFYSYLSADYTVKRDRWNDVAIEVYYHEPHVYNVDRMIDSIKKSLDYFTTNFGPYQHRQVRILEFPRYEMFAQSFPNTIPFSESAGFISRIDSEEDIDHVFYITAHEVAHQWWAHQVIGANVQGATLISESLAQYSALMVMEKEYGKDRMRRFLKYELDRYLDGRGEELVEELPLVLVENQMYIHYQKGSVVMYALRDYLGEDVLNGALSRYRDAVAFQEPPYTTSLEFLDYIREITPDSLTYIIEDMFETITLYINDVDEATFTRHEDGKYLVKLTVEARKLRSDGKGVETEIPINDYIDIGVFGEEEVDGRTGESVLYLRKHRITESPATFELVVDGKPVRAGIDPYNKLIDRNSDDNVKSVKEVTAEEQALRG